MARSKKTPAFTVSAVESTEDTKVDPETAKKANALLTRVSHGKVVTLAIANTINAGLAGKQAISERTPIAAMQFMVGSFAATTSDREVSYVHEVSAELPGTRGARFRVFEPNNDHGTVVNVDLRSISPALAEKIAKLVAEEG